MLERNLSQAAPAMTLHKQQDGVAALRDQQQSPDFKVLLAEILRSNVAVQNLWPTWSSYNMVTAELSQLAHSPLKRSEVQNIPAS